MMPAGARQPIAGKGERQDPGPGSRWGVRALVGVTRAVSVLPLQVTQALARLNRKGVRLYDKMPLPAYAESPETIAAPGDSA